MDDTTSPFASQLAVPLVHAVALGVHRRQAPAAALQPSSQVTGAWIVEVKLLTGAARYLVSGPSSISPQDQLAAETAVACGFYQP